MNASDAGILTQLSSGAALTALVGTRIYCGQAPTDAALPYVVFSVQSSIDLNDSPNRTRSMLYFVRGYSEDGLEVGAVDEAIDALLHHAALSVSGWTTLWVAREQEMNLVDNPSAGYTVYMAGGMYRLILQKN